MSQRSTMLLFLIFSIAAPAITAGSEPMSIPDGVEMILWEHQNWETNGGFERLTIWSDGRSEVVVVPLRYSRGGQDNLRPKPGWEKVQKESPPHVEFIRKNVYPPDVARTKFRKALAAGIHVLRSFKPGFHARSGTRIVIRIKGHDKEILIPMFMDREKGTLNHKRFLAVSEILGGFDKSAYNVIPK